MKLTILGCSGSMPGPTSPASGYLVSATDDAGRDWHIALDLGNGSLGTLQQHISLAELDGVCLSHLHPDHCLDMCGLWVGLKYNPAHAGRQIPVYGPPGTLQRLEAAYGLADDETMAAQFATTDWVAGQEVRIGPFTVTPFEAFHPVVAFCLRVAGPSQSGGAATLTYSGDTDACEGLDRAAQNADLLLCEATFHRDWPVAPGVHCTGERAGDTAHRAQVGRLILTHQSPWTDGAVVLGEAQQVFDGPIELAVSGGQYLI